MSFLNSIFEKKKILVTHNGTFHADDLFATAVLSILHDGNIEIIRTRDEELIKTADYVYDVGGIYDKARNRFDHHQKEGSGARPNGIPYASFGLVWEAYGEKICGYKEVADIIDRDLVSSIDAMDNGVNVIHPIYEGVIPYGVQELFLNYIPKWNEEGKNIDTIFEEQVEGVVKFLKREIEVIKSDIEGRNMILDAYKNTKDKRIVEADMNFPRYLFQSTLASLPEPVYLVYPSSTDDTWRIEAIRKSPTDINSRKLFPEAWRGFMDGADMTILEKETGISDIIFTHRNGFYIAVKSKESALALAQKSLIA